MTRIHDWSKVEPGLFHHFHLTWICHLADQFNGEWLPDKYFALIERRRVDSAILEDDNSPDIESYARRANRLVIRKEPDEVVAALEIVSPGNKHSVSSIESFVKKAVEFLRAKIHVLIIDLFPPTARDPQGLHQLIWKRIENDPFELPADKPLTLATNSSGDCITAYIEPVAVGDELPDMALFLTAESHVPAPLAVTYETTWSGCSKPTQRAVLASAGKDR